MQAYMASFCSEYRHGRCWCLTCSVGIAAFPQAKTLTVLLSMFLSIGHLPTRGATSVAEFQLRCLIKSIVCFALHFLTTRDTLFLLFGWGFIVLQSDVEGLGFFNRCNFGDAPVLFTALCFVSSCSCLGIHPLSFSCNWPCGATMG